MEVKETKTKEVKKKSTGKHDINSLTSIVEENSKCKLLKYERVNIKSKGRIILYLKCNCGKEYKTQLESFKKGKTTCRDCSNEKLRIERRHNIQDVINTLKNNDIQLLSDYKNNREHIKVKCLICNHVWECGYETLKDVHRCPNCKLQESKVLKDDFIKRTTNFQNEYSIEYDNYLDMNSKIKIKHNICNKLYEISAKTIIYDRWKCPKCYGLVYQRNEDDFKKELYELTNGEYKLVGNYKTTKDKIIIKHIKCNKEYYTTPSLILKGYGRCPVCEYRKSIGEDRISLFFDINKIQYNKEYKFDDCKYINKLPFDFYLPDYNLCIEFDGKQHFYPVEHFGGIKGLEDRKMKDNIKNKYCRDNGINILRIPYWDIDYIENILEDELEVYGE